MKTENKRNIDKIMAGMVLIALCFLIGPSYFFDWSTGELQSRNTLIIFLFLGGVYLVNSGFKVKAIELSVEVVKKSWRQFNWFFWPLLYIFATINGHIYRFVEMGVIRSDSGLGIVSAMEYGILPIFMVVLIYTKLSNFLSRLKSLAAASWGLLMSSFFFDLVSSVVSYPAYCLIIGALIYGIFSYFKNLSCRTFKPAQIRTVDSLQNKSSLPTTKKVKQIILFPFENSYLQEFSHLRDTRWSLRLFHIVIYLGWAAIVPVGIIIMDGDDLYALPLLLVSLIGIYWLFLQLLKTSIVYVMYGKKSDVVVDFTKHRKTLLWWFGAFAVAIILGVFFGHLEEVEKKRRSERMEVTGLPQLPKLPRLPKISS